MRRRLSLLFLSLVAGVLVAVGVPLGLSYAETRTQELFIDRAADASRFAQLAAPAFARGHIDTVHTELDAYADIYGIRVDIFDANGQLLASAARASEADGESLTADSPQRRAALLGRGPETPPTIFPWRTAPVTVAAPILQGRQVVGAVVTVSPTDRIRAAILTRWLALTGAGLLTVLAAGLLTVPLSRWMLRPVHRLDRAVQTMTSGDYATRVSVESGPPELRRLTLGFNAMAGAVSRSVSQQRALVADASHQLRNPLSALRLRIEDLADSLPDDERHRGQLALAEMDRLTHVLDDTLASARAEGDTHVGIAVDLSRCARDRLLAWSDLAERRQVSLVLDAPAPTWVLASGGVLEQLLDALLDNAIRFDPGGTVQVVVSEGPNMTALLNVNDDGPGLTPDQCELAVRRFWRGPDQQNEAGSGLGLSIVDALAGRLGGGLSLRPADPHGLVAELSLPLLVGACPEDAVRAGHPGSSVALPDAAARAPS